MCVNEEDAMRKLIPTPKCTRTVMAAVMLGTALSATGTAASGLPNENHAGVQCNAAKPDMVHAVMRYCNTSWRNARVPVDHWADCTQQVLLRLLERVPAERWNALFIEETGEKRELTRAVNTVKKRVYRLRQAGELSLDIAEQRNNNHEIRERWEEVHGAAKRVLSERQQKIVDLTALGWAVPEIAEQLGTTPERVSDEKYKAITKLRIELKVA